MRSRSRRGLKFNFSLRSENDAETGIRKRFCSLRLAFKALVGLILLYFVLLFKNFNRQVENNHSVDGLSTSGSPGINLPLLRHGFRPNRRFLLFSSVGKRSKPAVLGWMNVTNYSKRTFDVVLYYYDDQGTEKSLDCCRDKADYYFRRSDFKWPNLYHFLVENNIRPGDYDAIFAVDDDIIMNGNEIETLFADFIKYKLKYAQPSYDMYSSVHFPRLQRWRGNTMVRFANFVENAALVIDFQTVFRILDIMRDSKTGWGSDYCFFHRTKPAPHEMGTIHTVVATHTITKDPTKASNAFWEGLNQDNVVIDKRGNIDHPEDTPAQKEGKELMAACGAKIYRPRVYFRIKPGEMREDVINREKAKNDLYDKNSKNYHWSQF
mmetsp:Transcript_20268/g.24574  ORF Transcript_20268/g.24574 Transcript_20268/m.24574 type:complete len:379 (+) Transcript_20268:177-1313(+)